VSEIYPTFPRLTKLSLQVQLSHAGTQVSIIQLTLKTLPY